MSSGPYGSGLADVLGWTEYNGWGDNNYSCGCTLIYNNRPLDDSGVCLVGTAFEPGAVGAIQGNYSVWLLGGSTDAENSQSGASIGQTGQIPLGTESITYWGSGALNVTFDGQVLSFAAISSNPNYTVYQADISACAGQTGELLFTAPWPNGEGLLDNIQFSTVPVPETNSFGLFALGALLLACRHRVRPIYN